MGESHFKVPTDRSMLSVFGTNNVFDGDDFRDDGYVYRADRPVRKWFSKFVPGGYASDQARIWHPKLKQVKLLESKRWRWTQRARGIATALWDDIYPRVRNAVPFSSPHTYGNGSKGTIIFNSPSGVSWSPYDEKRHGEQPPLNEALAEAWFQYEKTSASVWTRASLFTHAFHKAINDNYSDYEKYGEYDSTLHLIINDRDYWFIRDSKKYRTDFWVKMSYPEDTTTETVVL